MKRFFLLTIISLICFTFETSAQRRVGVNEMEYKTLSAWKETNGQITEQLDELFKIITEHEGLDRNTYSRWRQECENIEDQYLFMLKYDGSKEISYKTDQWEGLNKSIKDCIKKVESIKSETTDAWEKNCRIFGSAFNRLKKECNEKYKNNSSNNSNNNIPNNDTRSSAKKKTSQKQRGFSLSDIEEIPYIEKNNDNSNLTNAFRVCCTYPLAVKYYGSGIKVALDAAGSMVNNKYITDPELLEHWKYYKPLLANYGKYNEEVINYLKKQKDKFENNNWIVDEIDVISTKRNITIDLSGYGSHYHQNYCIKYLDYVIDKYLDVLDRASKGEFTLSARFYDFFIKNELTPTEY